MIAPVEMCDPSQQQGATGNDDPLARMIGDVVVLDTDTPILYIGKLTEITGSMFVLADVDMHDCRDGHANKEHYLAVARQNGIEINRRRIVVMRSCVISVSPLADVVAD